MEGDELETVQYKFASIIGGLCGKPKIMSQFAIWLDLRLSEYKLKGAISLDCSGCRPDPDWLNGIKPDFSTIEQERFIAREAISAETLTPQEAVNTVIVKQEDLDRSERLMCSQKDFYPITLHDLHKQQYTQLRQSPHSSPENLSKNTPSTSHSCPSDVKIRKISDGNFPASTNCQTIKERETSDNEISPMNESLISLISPEEEAIVLDEDDNIESRLVDRSSDAADRLHESASSSHFPEAWSLPKNHQNSTASDDGWSLPTVQSLLQAHSAYPGISSDRIVIRNRIKNIEQKPVKSVRNVVAAVRCFELWLWHKYGGPPFNEKRQIFDIPPHELDPYLVQFFREIQKPNGGDFHHESFRCMRSRLESYLRDNDYPVSIVHSPEFSNSILAYKDRIAILRTADQANKMNDSELGQI